MCIAAGMTLFSYEWLEKYFAQKEKLQLAAIEEFEYFGIKVEHIDDPVIDLILNDDVES